MLTVQAYDKVNDVMHYGVQFLEIIDDDGGVNYLFTSDKQELSAECLDNWREHVRSEKELNIQYIYK